MKPYIIWLEYKGKEMNLTGDGSYHDYDTALEIAQDWLWKQELRNPDLVHLAQLSLVPIKSGGRKDWSAAEPVEI